MAKLTEQVKKKLEHMHYEIVGSHSAIEICSWAKKSLLDKGFCYKQKFYGIKSHRCCQMSPSVAWCNQSCCFCWRPIEDATLGCKMSGRVDEPKEIIEGCIKAQRRKLSGFKGNEKINMQKFKEAQNPNQFAISLAGEPTLYPKLPELIKELHRRKCTTFLVTNGTNPQTLSKLRTQNSLPIQLYVSLDAPNEELYLKINRPRIKNGWKKLNQTLAFLPKLTTRKVIRITLIKGLNDCCIPEYAKLIKKANPHFVEVKSYMFVGYSRKRMKKENMPLHDDVIEFSRKLAEELGWKIIDDSKPSRVALLAEKDYAWRILKN